MATDANFEQAREFFLAGNAHYQAGRFAEAERSYEAALALVPGRPSTLTNLGATRMKLGRLEEALELFEEALAQEPAGIDSLGLKATALAELGRHLEALAAFDALLAARPDAAQAWSLRGSVLHELKRRDEAAESFRKALALGGDAEVNGYYLAAITRGAPPPTAPRSYVQALFDSYAGGFDAQLVEQLKYQAPQVLAEGLRKLGRRFGSALDLGCGTGLCGPLVKPMADRLEGVDLSPAMMAKAEALGVYDRLQLADVNEFLRTASGPYELVISADVFIYVGALDNVFEQVARCMPAGGVFCFSLEESEDGRPLALRESRRYAHSEASVRELSRRFGFEVVDMRRAPIREDQRVPIPGLYFWLARKA